MQDGGTERAGESQGTRPQPVVLFVDDDPTGREVFEAMLEGEGYTLVAAGDGFEALAKAKEALPDLILLDVMMPGLDGFEVLRRLRADPVLGEAPVILVTALNDRDSRLRGIEVGADDFLTKPIDRFELRARVRTVTRINRFRRLLTERAKFEWAVETADDGFLLLGGDDRILYANAEARRLLDLPPDRAAPLEDGFLALSRRRYRCEPEAAWAPWPAGPAGGPIPVRYLVRPESGNTPAQWLQVAALALPTASEGEWLVRLRDVTGSLRAQREVWAFHSAINHKLRTPLTAILPALEFLASDAAALPPEVVADLAGAALRSTQRLTGEIQDVLQYLDVSQQPWVGEGFDPGGLGDLVQSVAAALEVPNVEVSREGRFEGTRLALSGRALELLLGEIVENARKFHPHGSPRVEILLSRPASERARLVVRDDGISLSPSQLAQVLAPYYQGERVHTGQVTGMGLGLAMVASIAWNVGGDCRVFNRADGPGVVVELLLPLLPIDEGVGGR